MTKDQNTPEVISDDDLDGVQGAGSKDKMTAVKKGVILSSEGAEPSFKKGVILSSEGVEPSLKKGIILSSETEEPY
jgi:hypothetical protein